MSDMLDKNGNPLKGGAVWLRTVSLDGGLEEHDKKVAVEAFSSFLNENPTVASSIVKNEKEKKKTKLKLVK